MKKVFILMLGLVAGSASFAQDVPPQTSASATKPTWTVIAANQKIKLFIEPLSGIAHIALWDADGHPLYSEKVTLEQGVKQQFDVSNLANGSYRLTITTGKQTVSKTFDLQDVPVQRVVSLQS